MEHTTQGGMLTGIILETFKLNGILVSEGDQLVKEFGLTSARWKILGALSYGTTAMTVPMIAQAMGQSRQSVQRISNEMIKDGLLKTQNNPDHQRAKFLVLTEQGVNMYGQAMQKQIPWVNLIADHFEQSDLELAASVLQKLITQLLHNKL